MDKGEVEDFKPSTMNLANLHWFRWDTSEVYRLNTKVREWQLRKDIKIAQKFLFFSAVLHLPNDQGCFIMGGSDNDDNYSKRVQYFLKYNVFLEKPPMIYKRAFFAALFTKLDNSIFVIGGSDSNSSDLVACEKFSLLESVWRPMASMKIARNGISGVVFEQYRLLFVFGGNNHKLGSLAQIEKYEIDFDKWSLLDVQLKKPLHDMSVLQVAKDRVLIFGGHTEGGGPNREISLIDLSMECFKARFGNNLLNLPASSSGGKTYFPPHFDPSSGKVQLIFGYCDEAPKIEEIDISDFALFHLQNISGKQSLSASKDEKNYSLIETSNLASASAPDERKPRVYRNELEEELKQSNDRSRNASSGNVAALIERRVNRKSQSKPPMGKNQKNPLVESL